MGYFFYFLYLSIHKNSFNNRRDAEGVLIKILKRLQFVSANIWFEFSSQDFENTPWTKAT